ncbi:hypothetical protein KKB11_02000 [Candidatus Micrarchaeota archaeon]|nr:hypothetical protein [Candidatus Micrarchaeota archaeon]
MKKTFLLAVVFALFFCAIVSAVSNGQIWTPGEMENYTFPPVPLNEEFTITIKHYSWWSYTSAPLGGWSYSRKEFWGTYGSAPGWPIITPTEATKLDANLFTGPIEAGCTIINYDQNVDYFKKGGDRISDHNTTITLNCTVEGDYTIKGGYKVYYQGCDEFQNCTGDWIYYSGPTEQLFHFTVLPATNTSPYYDYNLFWSKIKSTKRHYIHVWDVDEQLEGGKYFIKSFEVKVEPDCEIIGGGAKNLDKNEEVGTWKMIGGSATDKTFELTDYTKVFQEGVDGYAGTEDNYLDSAGASQNQGATTQIYIQNPGTIRNALIRFNGIEAFINPGSEIVSATIDMNTSLVSGTGSPTLSVYNIWKYPWTEADSSWNKFDGTNSWCSGGAEGTAGNQQYNNSAGCAGGADRKPSYEDTLTLTKGATNFYNRFWSETDGTLEVTASLQDQLNAFYAGSITEWAGWLIKTDIETITSYSSEYGTLEIQKKRRPKLKVGWNDPLNFGAPLDPPKDANNLNLYVDVKCNSWGLKDFNLTITDAENHETQLKTKIIDFNAYEDEENIFPYPDRGPPGVNLRGPLYAADHGRLYAEAFGVTDYETNINHFFENGTWMVCAENIYTGGGLIQCILNQDLIPEGHCKFTDTIPGLDDQNISAEDYDFLIGSSSVFQQVQDEGFLVCNTTGHRKLLFFGTSTAGGNVFLDVEDFYVMDISSYVAGPFYVVKDENITINGKAFDREPPDDFGDIEILEAKWYSYDDFCGPKTEFGGIWKLVDQTYTPFNIDGNINWDVNATIHCDEIPPNGYTRLNLTVWANREYYPGGENVYIKGHTKAIVLLRDSLRMDLFETVPSKARKNSNVTFSATVKSKYDKLDLNVEVEFSVYDKETNELITTVTTESKMVPKSGQKTFTYSFNTSIQEIKENTAYRVTATAYLVSGAGKVKDRDAINDVLERYFWVLDAEDKLSQLPETNLTGILLVLVAVSLILLKTKKE